MIRLHTFAPSRNLFAPYQLKLNSSVPVCYSTQNQLLDGFQHPKCVNSEYLPTRQMSDPVKVLLEEQAKDERFIEIHLNFPSGDIRGKWWGPRNIQPILCFHGWQDNCGVFDRLIPLLPNEFSYLALDIPGHGLSSFTTGSHYSNFDSLLFIEDVRVFHGWKKISIIAHSLMAMVAFNYAAIFPNQLEFVVFLDNLIPLRRPSRTDYLNRLLGKVRLENERLHRNEEPPSYKGEDLIDRIHTGSLESVSKENCKYLIPRGVRQSSIDPTRYYFRRDARLKYYFEILLHPDENLEDASKITAPCLFLYGNRSPTALKDNANHAVAAQMKRCNPKFSVQEVQGNHHFFLNSPENCSKLIEEFIYKWREVKNKL